MKKESIVLRDLFSSTYVLYIKVYAYHWNVISHHFFEMHAFFEKQYRELFDAVDKIAEQIRSIGEFPPASVREILEFSFIKEGNAQISDEEMVKNLLSDNRAIADHLARGVDSITDVAINGFVSERIAYHQKTAWTLQSSL